jgi:hypothetical protein
MLQRKDYLRTYNRLDRAGMTASSLCAIHCLLMPLVVALLPIAGIRWLASEQAEWVMVGISVMIGLASLLPSYIRHHRRKAALIVFIMGVLFILIGRTLFAGAEQVEPFLVIYGALAVAASHVINKWLCHTCSSCQK